MTSGAVPVVLRFPPVIRRWHGARSRSCDQCADEHRNKEKAMAETYSGEFYCVKCKAKREASGEVHVNDKGTRMAKAKCPVCGTNLNRILGRV